MIIHLMSLPPSKKREILLFFLYDQESAKKEEEGFYALIMHTLKVTKKSIFEVQDEAKKVMLHVELLDRLIDAKAHSVDAKRILGLERAILRLSVYNLLYEKNLPTAIVISEAIRLTGKFADPVFIPIIQAILNAIEGEENCQGSDK